MRNINSIVLHHSAIPFKQDQFQSIDRSHRNRWGRGIEYHYLIEKDGRVKKGKPESQVGWHCGVWGINQTSIGVCLAGNLVTEPIAKHQRESFMHLVIDIQRQYGIPNERILLHRDIKATTCPAIDLLSVLEKEYDSYLERRVKQASHALKRATPARRNRLQRFIKRVKRLLGIV